MPYKDIKVQREFQRRWMAKRRSEYFDGKRCSNVNCRTPHSPLQLHHKNPADKKTHRIWSYTKEKREEELAKCEVLCEDCHSAHHKKRGEPEPFCSKPPYL